MESEIIALATASEETGWLRSLPSEIPLWEKSAPTILIHCDSTAAIAKVQNLYYDGKRQQICHKHSTIKEFLTTASRAASIRKEIYSIMQFDGETLNEYWERFKKTCAEFPHHQISDQLLIQYFYEGLIQTDKSSIDAAAEGALVNKTLTEAMNLIATMAANSQQFGTRAAVSVKSANELAKVEIGQPAVVCQVCHGTGHSTNVCPSALQGAIPEVNVVATIIMGKTDGGTHLVRPTILDGETTQTSNREDRISRPSLIMELRLVQDTQHFQQDTRKDIEALGTQVSQLATSMSKLEIQSGKLPSQPESMLKENVSAITLRSGKELEPPVELARVKEAVAEKDKELLEMFRRVEINILLLDAIKQIPKYAKFSKDLCTRKRQAKEKERMVEVM
ncbi:uncharacterized protein LOC120090650 [Benincasa hispida]|uniref:uncharacterized protein LOC120090650 n=1 Tax=Benincasa hispida TaxID=102211 RepID=UPI001901B766|nr:uncharacterized protein LOC120090650 [Benincasa hispida]